MPLRYPNDRRNATRMLANDDSSHEMLIHGCHVSASRIMDSVRTVAMALQESGHNFECVGVLEMLADESEDLLEAIAILMNIHDGKTLLQPRRKEAVDASTLR